MHREVTRARLPCMGASLGGLARSQARRTRDQGSQIVTRYPNAVTISFRAERT